jgi:hypothetical protein
MRLSVCLALLLAGCGHDELLVPDAAIEPCSNEPAECYGTTKLRSCVNGLWQTRACRDVCRQELPGSTTASCQQPLGGPAACACGVATCGSGFPACQGSHAIFACTDGGTAFQELCFDVCQASLETPLSSGCEFDRGLGEERCYCTSEGAACAGTEWDQCEGKEALGRCQDGKWVVIPCVEPCGPEESLGCWFEDRTNRGKCHCAGLEAGAG